jgi:hypothetical protein
MMRYTALILCAAAFWTLTPYAIVSIVGERKVRGIVLVTIAATLFGLCLLVSRDIGIHTDCAGFTVGHNLPHRGGLCLLSGTAKLARQFSSRFNPMSVIQNWITRKIRLQPSQVVNVFMRNFGQLNEQCGWTLGGLRWKKNPMLT